MKKAFITGVAGQDGSYMADLLLEKGYKVYGLTRHHGDPQKNWRIKHLFTNKNFILVTGDITDPSSISTIIAEIQPKELYHFAAQSFVGRSWQDASLTFEVNVIGTLNVLEAVRKKSPKTKILQASSSEMFGRSDWPQNENTPLNPVSPYGVSKLAAHHLCKNYRESYGMFVACAISFNHESPRRGGSFVTKKIINAFARARITGKKQVLELGNINASRDWGHARDYVKAMWKMLQINHANDFVLGTGIFNSVEDFINKCVQLIPLNEPITFKFGVPHLLRPVDDFSLQANSEKAWEILRWRAETNLDELIKEMFEFELKELEGIASEPCRDRS